MLKHPVRGTLLKIKSVFNVMLAYGFYQRAIPHLNITHLRRHKCGYLSDT